MIFINIFNLFAKLTLDKSSYEYALKQSTQLTKQQASSIKQTFNDMSKKNVEAMKRLINQLEKGEISLEEYRKKVDEVKRSQNQLDATSQELGLTTQKTGASSIATWTAVATAVIAVLNKVKDLILETANYADNIGDLAQKWGFTTQEIQEFDYWATMSGTTLESLLTGMRGLVNQAEAGSSAFNRLGVSVKNADGSFKDQKTLFLETIDALQGVEDQTLRNALQFEIFGRAGIELGQIINRDAEELNALSQEAESLGIILSEDTINQAGEFNDELDKMRLSFKSVMAEIIAGSPDAEEKFTVFLDNLVDRFVEWSPKFVKIVINLLSKLLVGAIEIVQQLPSIIMDALMSINWLQVGLDIGKSLLDGIFKSLGALIGYGWLWGEGSWFGLGTSPNITTTDNAISTINNIGSVERTEKIDETLDITLRVEGDGTEVSEANLNIVSDLVVDKINEILGGEV